MRKQFQNKRGKGEIIIFNREDKQLLLISILTLATVFYCGFADNPVEAAEQQTGNNIVITTQSDGAIGIRAEQGAIRIAGESGTAAAVIKPLRCEVENGTKLIKAKPKPKPQVLTASASRGGARSRMVAMSVPTVNTSFKSYMDYRSITNQSSKQWKLQQQAYTNAQGFRMIGDDYLVALGTFYAGGCGERFRVTLSSGTTFTVMTGDIKSNRHTNETRQYCPRSDGSGNMIEFIVDSKAMSRDALRMGNLSCLGLEGSITKIEKIVS